MRVLITGGAGFIGSHLAERLLEQGHHVAILDDLSTGRLENVAHLADHPRFSTTIGSVLDEALLEPLVAQCDTVFHLAAAVGVRLVVDQPIHTIHTNVHGTETVLKHASRGRKNVLVVSTSEVYGKSAILPFREDADLVLGPPNKTRWGYATSKLLDEFLALGYWKEERLPVRVVRLFNTVGPRQSSRYGMVLPNFVQRALRNEPIVVHGDGSQTRSFTWVGDVVSALIGLVENPGTVRRGLQRRQRRRDQHLRPRGEGEAEDGKSLAHRVRPLQPGVRRQLRGHAAARPRHRQDRKGDRLSAESTPR